MLPHYANKVILFDHQYDHHINKGGKILFKKLERMETQAKKEM